MKLLSLSKGQYYYKRVEDSKETFDIMKRIDEIYTDNQTVGVIKMTEYLKLENYRVGYRRIRRLMRKMGIQATYPKPNLSKLGLAKYIQPYLLRKLKISRPNQVWSIDITYIPMSKGFMYLTAIIDVYSRMIVGWGLHNTLEASNSREVLNEAIMNYGTPEIVNSDQGSQYTCKEWVKQLKENGIQISMDGYKRCRDNAWIERFWRTIKREYIYITPEENGTDLYRGIYRFIKHYNTRRPHQGINNEVPSNRYLECQKMVA